jgi:hypothetical protein
MFIQLSRSAVRFIAWRPEGAAAAGRGGAPAGRTAMPGLLSPPRAMTGAFFGSTTTLVPTSTRLNRSATSSLVRRMQPDETNFPIVEGSLVP